MTRQHLVSVSLAHSPSQILASLSDGTLSESIRVPVAKLQYLSRQGGIQSSSLPNPWPRPGLTVLFIESLCIMPKKTVLNRTLRRTRTGLNREPLNREPFNPTPVLETEVCVQNITPLYAINYEVCYKRLLHLCRKFNFECCPIFTIAFNRDCSLMFCYYSMTYRKT